MSNSKFKQVGTGKVLTTEEMCMRSQKQFASWNDKDDYCFTFRLKDGDVKMHDEVWASVTSKIPQTELKRINGEKIYLGSIDKINLRYDDMRQEYAKPSSEAETNEAITVNVVFESFKHPHYPLTALFENWNCVDLILYRSE